MSGRTAIQASIKRASKAAQSSMNQLDAAALDDLEQLYKQAAAEIEQRIQAHAAGDGNLALSELQSLRGQIDWRLGKLAESRNVLLQQKLGEASALGVEPFAAPSAHAAPGGEGGAALLSPSASMQINQEALQFVRTFVAADGLQLSDRIWRLDRHAREAVTGAIEQAIIQGHGASQAAREFLMKGLPVPADIAAKQGAANAAKVGKTAGELLFKGPGTPLDNAKRLFRTEINRAHGTAYQKGAEAHPDCVGTRFLLSPSHPQHDICDLHASANLYGLGKGVYPHGKNPWPAHPNTLSYVEAVFKDEVTAEDAAGKQTAMEALDQLKPAQQKGALGVGKYKLFKDGALTQGMIRTPLAAVKARLRNKFKAEVSAAQKDVAKESGAAALERAISKAQERSAANTLDAIATAGKAHEQQALKALKKSGALADLPATQALQKVQQTAAELKGKKQINDALSKYKQAALAGKAPPPAALKAFETLSDAEKQDFLVKLDQAKQAAALKASKADTLDFSAFDQIGPQRGSNRGGLYRNRVTGEQWYIKIPASEDVARNEVLAAKLYQAAGIDVPELRLIDVNGSPGVASRIIDGLQADAAALKAGKVAGAFDGFAVDAWLGNWDVVGMSFDNLLIKGGRAWRVDTGGALRYRAQGGLKGSQWGPNVSELDTLRNPQMNPQSAAAFKKMTRAQLEASAHRVANLSDEQIRKLVQDFGPRDAKDNVALAETLIARKNDLVRRILPNEKPLPLPADAAARVTDSELAAIRESGVNGYVLTTDKGGIEDHHVLLWVERTAGGAERTMATFKVTPSGSQGLKDLLKAAGVGPSFDDKGLFDSLVTAIKGIASQAAKGETLRAKDIERVQAALKAHDQARSAIKGGAALAAFDQHFQPWIQAVSSAVKAGEGKAAKWTSPGGQLAKFEPPLEATGAARIKFTRKNGSFELKDVRRGRATATGKVNFSTAYYYEAEIDGATVRYWPDASDVPFALRNKVEIAAPGGNAESARGVFDRISQLGVESGRAGALDREELYLRQIAYHRRDGFDSFTKAVEGIAAQEDRVAAMRAWLSDKTGKDIADLPGYNPDGSYQAFGQGRKFTYRPDLVGKDWDKFQDGYLLHHHITQGGLVDSIERILNGGGQMAPTVDKLRRGIPIGGMSPVADLNTGGASYFFTRIQTKAMALKEEGINWKSKLVSRLDAISYNHDAFGRVSGDYVLSNRKSGVEEWKQTAKARSNETIFKNSLSLFDDVDSIMVNARDYNRLLEAFKKNGYATWPDGRPLTEVIRKIGSV